MNPTTDYLQQLTRRHFFARGAMGLGTAALASMTAGASQPALAAGGVSGVPHFTPQAKRAIYLFMAGAPSPPDLLDYKPKMAEKLQVDLRGEKYEDGSPVLRTRVTTMTSGQASFPIAPSMYKFAQHGQSRAWVSELLPYTARMVDRHRHHPFDVDRSHQSRPGDHLHQHRQPASRAAQPGRMVELRIGERKLRPAGVRRDDALLDRPQRRPGPVQPPVGFGIPTQQAPGRRSPLERRPCALLVEPSRRRSSRSSPRARRHRGAQREAACRDRRSRNRLSHCAV